MADTVTVRGAGGFVFEMDLPAPGTALRENVDHQFATGALVVVDPPSKPAAAAAVARKKGPTHE